MEDFIKDGHCIVRAELPELDLKDKEAVKAAKHITINQPAHVTK